MEAFEAVIASVECMRYGFDYVNDESILCLFNELSHYHRKKIGASFDIEGNVTSRKFRDTFNDAYEDQAMRLDMWKEVFVRLNRFQKEIFLKENEAYYQEGARYLLSENYDWSSFQCVLKEEGKTSQLQQIQRNWSELGVQVYDCASNNNGNLCPCLRAASDTTAYKCFRNYLQSSGKDPYGKVPDVFLREAR
ncbi:hypothetical protein NBRC13296_12525 [Paenibacillus chitinolyticus]|uniref:hypothetical protein n=1 Tax=Paenibacillus chitinolyticus TaxID=79263 RepID=UPI0035576912